MSESPPADRQCLIGVTLDEASLGRGTPDQEHERAIAIYDLIERNHFALPEHEGGPYLAHLALVERRLVFEIKQADGTPVIAHHLSLTPFKRIIKDYEMVCESYYAAIRTATPSQIEAIDMGRRGLHDEAAGILVERLATKVEVDHDTARRFFTLIYALHWKG
ncbi:UPF0262 family protein [Bosea sp. PAMC 26642]|uniref:UPF0262 family protein n=1 Tax=Bosea sp. (strain PAMC 26642) TaxID=1792307 RepID=UPI0007701490|nr:UPF0262 family protein [Bosea sp. PAMC 26642]AMJ63275.1 hypothetical protein AXW83_25890 [Bosea sp. PAMC 26642]